ncbi:DUF4870 domain-containing protein [Leptolyngbya sp. FACHB-16]|nr:DUF4870 domain-containing protein [Leptolyngbya sp. FACHB-16]MBD1913088.1 DUF4870 domain-containing protein [Leptolyngbya sp. FACHB-8]MBD2154411.1 DUF4870 domain-containing protein [Leptolyngbya sp. FACHB-16]
MADSNTRKILSVICHASVFFTSTVAVIGVPLVILFVSQDPVVKANAKEVLNLQINLLFYGLVFGLLVLVGIGIPLLILLGIASIILPIFAIISVLNHPNTPASYPFISRIL